MSQHHKTRINLNLGSSSLLLIFVVLSLVSFSVLSLSTALSDKALTDKTTDRTISYYSACNIAQDSIKEYDDAFYEIFCNTSDESAYIKGCNEILAPIMIPVSDYHSLQVIVEPNYPASENDPFLKIVSFQVVLTSEPNLDFSINVIK